MVLELWWVCAFGSYFGLSAGCLLYAGIYRYDNSSKSIFYNSMNFIAMFYFSVSKSQWLNWARTCWNWVLGSQKIVNLRSKFTKFLRELWSLAAGTLFRSLESRKC